MLRLEGISHKFKTDVALSGVDVEISGVTALIGVNGAGKSTLLNIAAGGLRPSAGSVYVGNANLFERKERRRALRKVALMPQSATFPGGMTVLEVVEYIAWMRGASSRRARSSAVVALDRVLLADRAASKVNTLSGGMLRRLCLAQAIVADAEVLLLDEPSTGLDPEQRRVMVDRLTELDGTVLLSSHVMEDVSDLAERVVILDAGSIVFDGSIQELKEKAPEAEGARAAEAGFLSVLVSNRGGVA